ncbi:glycoside hydrolase family 32 protein [Microbacterium rhizosphaerae]|uniref:Glycoside hydrolase family 32 protein n=1 Tax=Microbacterium rhizosphaerae TaxID=1678237 RepID=A0ABZ0SL88_9MICO|nr:glycoside hydrolase family 32 protein [Microbacterium rhizosphaerae]WPR89383.1 glycoside hydrolase family 32 protein [Microbacterium rhizosphaerae]
MTRRPLIHFTAARNWLNDPNGLVFHEGRYHLFFQHNPFGDLHSHMSWGHASSVDLMRWEEHPVAIPCDEGEWIFSGSAVVDADDTSGFGAPGQTPLVAVYTSVDAVTLIQRQALAYSVDGGITWTKHAGNPVLDRGSRDFRDPKVFRYGDGADAFWVMVAVEAEDRQIVLYRSDDLRSWEYLSAYGPAGAVGGAWECPDLFPLALDDDPDDIRWVLVISLYPGGVAGGSGTQYVVGSFDGVRFTPDRPVGDDLADVDWLDLGRDCYAGVTFNGLPLHERTLIAWMSNWDYAAEVPTSPWRGSMTVPRRLSLVTVDGRPQLRSQPILPAGEAIEPTAELPAAARIDVRASLGGDGGGVCIDLVGAEGRVSVGCRRGRVTVDRRAAGEIHPGFPSVESACVPGDADAVDVTIVVDTCSVEVFAAGGLRSITDLALLGDARRLEVSTEGTAVVETLAVIDLGGGA